MTQYSWYEIGDISYKWNIKSNKNKQIYEITFMPFMCV